LKQLKSLVIVNSNLSENDIKNLEKTLPGCNINAFNTERNTKSKPETPDKDKTATELKAESNKQPAKTTNSPNQQSKPHP
jgi:hypothetical protein